MPFRLGREGFEGRAKIQFTTFLRMPSLIYRACLATGIPSNTVYVQRAVCEALARDLEMDLAQLLAELPTPRGPAAKLFAPENHPMNRYGVPSAPLGDVLRIGPANTIEEVR